MTLSTSYMVGHLQLVRVVLHLVHKRLESIADHLPQITYLMLLVHLTVAETLRTMHQRQGPHLSAPTIPHLPPIPVLNDSTPPIILPPSLQ